MTVIERGERLMVDFPFRKIMLLLLLVSIVLVPVKPACASCVLDPDVPLAITKLNWAFNPKTGVFKLDAEVLNVSEWDVVEPGIAVALYDSAGKELDSNLSRSPVKRIRPGERAPVQLVMELARIPGTVKVLPFQRNAGT
jgi:hypothetical protein